MSEKRLERLQAKGIKWSTALSIVTFVAQFVVLFYLNKIIPPKEFGRAAWALSAFMIFFSFINLSFDRVAIRKKNMSKKDYSAIFYFSLIINLSLFLVFFFGVANLNLKASQFAKPFIRAFSFVFLLHILKVVPSAMMHRALLFDRISLINMSSKVIGLLGAIFFSLQANYFLALLSLYAGPKFLNTTFHFFAIKWTIPKFRNFEFIKENFGIAASFSFHGLLGTLSNNLDAILVGQQYGEQATAEWHKSKGFQNLPLIHVVGPIGQVLYPTFSKIQDSTDSLSRFFFKAQSLIAFMLIPAFMLLFTLARPFASIYFSEGETDWDISTISTLLQIFSFTGFFAMFNPVFYPFFQVTSKRKSINQLVVFQRVIFVVLIFATFKLGLLVLAFGKLASELCALIINTIYAKNYFLKKELYPALKNIVIVFLISILVCLFAYFFFYQVSLGVPEMLHFVITSLLTAVLYMALSYSLNKKGFLIFKEIFLSNNEE